MELLKILLVEDDHDISEGVSEYLKESGYHVEAVYDGLVAVDTFYEHDFDCVVLDIMLPGMNGIEVLQAIRTQSNIPIIMLTAMDDDLTQIQSFDAKADDYINKPFSLKILKRRIEALLRRSQTPKPDTVTINDRVSVDFKEYIALLDGENKDLKLKEFEVLRVLYENRGMILSREQIIDKIYDDASAPYDRVVDVYVKNIRKKLEIDNITTVKGVGYRYDEI